MEITVNRLFIESYRLEVTRDGDHLEFALWFEADLETLAARIGWPPTEIRAQFVSEARDIGRELFKGLPVAWTSFHDGEGCARGEFYRAESPSENLVDLVLGRVP